VRPGVTHAYVSVLSMGIDPVAYVSRWLDARGRRGADQNASGHGDRAAFAGSSYVLLEFEWVHGV
jgi:hypothetical protein